MIWWYAISACVTWLQLLFVLFISFFLVNTSVKMQIQQLGHLIRFLIGQAAIFMREQSHWWMGKRRVRLNVALIVLRDILLQFNMILKKNRRYLNLSFSLVNMSLINHVANAECEKEKTLRCTKKLLEFWE